MEKDVRGNKMTPLEKQVTSLEWSKRLKELGVKQESLFYWCKNIKLGDKKFDLGYGTPLGTWQNKPSRKWLDGEMYSAFTVAEHGEALPSSIKTDYGSLNYLHIAKLKNTKEWLIGYFHDEIKGNTLANACAKMRIWLIENKLEEAK